MNVDHDLSRIPQLAKQLAVLESCAIPYSQPTYGSANLCSPSPLLSPNLIQI